MVAPITLNVRHIRGHTFTVEVDHDADALGLKVVIWESQRIPVEQQRLVFAGKELSEGSVLSSMGITDGAQIFLVESGVEDGAFEVSSIGQEQEVTAAVVPPAFAPEMDVASSGSFAVQMPAPQSRYERVNSVEVIEEDEASGERIAAAIALAKYVRVFCIFGFILSLIATVFCCYWSAIMAIIYLLGWIGTRKLNRCLLVFPMIKVFLTGFGGMAYLIYCGIEYPEMFDFAWATAAFALIMFILLLHVMIFMCMCKLCCRIGKLSRDEWCNARAKILARSCCC